MTTAGTPTPGDNTAGTSSGLPRGDDRRMRAARQRARSARRLGFEI